MFRKQQRNRHRVVNSSRGWVHAAPDAVVGADARYVAVRILGCGLHNFARHDILISLDSSWEIIIMGRTAPVV